MVLARTFQYRTRSIAGRCAGRIPRTRPALAAYSTRDTPGVNSNDFAAIPGLSTSNIPDTLSGGASPRYGPSLIWKAYALALRPYLSTDADMASRGFAMFIASPFTLGIPGGSLVPAEIRNQAIANRCDRLMVPDSPIYDDSSSNASYFETLFDYLSSVDVTSSASAGKARLAESRANLKAAQEAALLAYNNDQARFVQVRQMDPTVNFTQWMKDFGIEYAAAFAELQDQQAQYKQLLSNTSGPVGAAMDLMLAARTRLSSQAGSNMPCSAQDMLSTIAADGSQSPITLDNKSVFYRPLHSLSGYDRCIDAWISSYDANRPPTIRMDLDLETAASIPWSSFGFAGLSDAPSYPTRNAANLRTDLSSAASDISRPRTPSITVALYGVQAFDVDRGFWNIDGIRHFQLAQDKVDMFTANKLMKITRILCGYKVQVQISGDGKPGARKSARNQSLASASSAYQLPFSSPSAQAFLGSLKPNEDQQDGLIRLTTQNDSIMVPQLLAVLARRI